MTSKAETTMTGKDGLAVISGVILLLEAAANRCLNILAADPTPGPEESFALSDLGLGARLAAGEARGLLPIDLEPADVPPAAASPESGDPLELVRAAEALTRTVPIEAQPPGSSRVVIALCDLLREHG